MTYVTSASELPSIASAIPSAVLIALDLETENLDPRGGRIRLLSLNINGNVYVIDVFQTGRPEAVIAALRDYHGVIVGHGLKFDQKWCLFHWGLEFKRIFDTYRASALIYNGVHRGKGAHDLWALYRRELGIEPNVQDLGASNWSGALAPEQIAYAADDVTQLPKLYTILRKKLIEKGLVQTATLEFGAALPEAAMELNGFYLDQDKWGDLAIKNMDVEQTLREELLRELPHPKGLLSLFGIGTWNLGSPDQLLKSLHRAGIRVPNTAEMTLAMQATEYPILQKVINWRGYAQCVKSFGLEYLSNLHPKTQRIHTSFFPFTGAGRYSSSKPNLQQIPRGKEFRGCFTAAPGKKLVIADYSQIELRIAAEIANDHALITGYQTGADAHTLTGAIVAGVPIAQVTKAHRQMAKPVNFGFIYGMQAEKFVLYARANYGVTMTLNEAERFRDTFFRGYPGIERWHEDVFDWYNKKKGWTRTLSGRIRYLPPDAHNEYANTPVQGTGADGLKRALRIVYDKTKSYAALCHMVHDEIVLEVDDTPELLDRAETDLKAGMIEGMQPFLKKVPVVVEGGTGSSWAEK